MPPGMTRRSLSMAGGPRGPIPRPPWDRMVCVRAGPRVRPSTRWRITLRVRRPGTGGGAPAGRTGGGRVEGECYLSRRCISAVTVKWPIPAGRLSDSPAGAIRFDMDTDALFPSPAASTIWGKTGLHSTTYAATDWHPLLAHMLDTMHVADRLWEHYLAPSLRERFSAGLTGTGTPSGDRAGRAAFRWLAALHDIGKATPGFQSLSAHHFPPVLRLLPLSVHHEPFRHELSSAQLVRMFLEEESWAPAAIDWVADVVGGHHGTFPPPGLARSPRTRARLGGGNWREVQRELFATATRCSGVDLASLAVNAPGIGGQMAIAGALALADWLAGDDELFGHSNGWPSDYPADSARIAARFRPAAELGTVWRPRPPAGARELYASRFGFGSPSATQLLAFDLAKRATGPGLMVVEAPASEGKTTAALAAAEVLAARLGCNGLFYALPGRATVEQAAARLAGWLDAQDPRPTVGLADGRARRGARWDTPLSGIGESAADTEAAAAWLRGADRALLAPVVVGTLDRLLRAGVSAAHVMIRHTVLAGKVVVVDGVPAYDTAATALLHRVLHWLGRHGTPVVVLAAALSDGQRAGLLSAYSGARRAVADGTGYPRITWVPAPGAGAGEEAGAPPGDTGHADRLPPLRSHPARPARGSGPAVELAPEAGDDAQHVADLVSGLVAAGSDPADPTAAATGRGCVLVLRATVERAQAAYGALSARFPGECTLVHEAFTAADRARLDAGLARRFGPPERSPGTRAARENPHRPQRHIVVATPSTVQPLDIDVDVLVTDLAPIDVLLRCAGLCHRHDRPGPRPAGLERPRVIITGFSGGTAAEPPRFPGGHPYPDHLLLRTLARLLPGDGAGPVDVAVPAGVPGLLASVYGDDPLGPEAWHGAMAAAASAADQERARLSALAGSVLIARPDDGEQGVVRLGHVQRNGGGHGGGAGEGSVGGPAVHPGAPGIEVLLLRRTGASTAETVSLPAEGGRPLTVPLAGMPDDEQKEAVLGQAVRLPADRVDAAALASPDGWRRAPWCSGLPVLFLDPKSDDAHLRGRTYRYSPYTGWQETA
ncbi:CRISPR-associated endonuclease Cas3'' [Nocardiopsis sediminis]|uniref:CRISPR-associated endonuclease Cas3 n=1 Tax=Nocardiopsis sediminis TaxID=1778267 RepID=A0ABV8FKW7_9ACTN